MEVVKGVKVIYVKIVKVVKVVKFVKVLKMVQNWKKIVKVVKLENLENASWKISMWIEKLNKKYLRPVIPEVNGPSVKLKQISKLD